MTFAIDRVWPVARMCEAKSGIGRAAVIGRPGFGTGAFVRATDPKNDLAIT
jgi:hypothetical protein